MSIRALEHQGMRYMQRLQLNILTDSYGVDRMQSERRLRPLSDDLEGQKWTS